MKSVICSIALAVSLIGCGNTESEAPAPSPKTETKKTSAQLDFDSLKSAIAATVPEMTDFREVEISKGAAILAYWASRYMKWSELQETSAGKYALVMKDPDTQRGKLLCINGRVIEIQVENTTPKKVYLGGMYDDAGHIYRFVAVGSSGEIVASSRAKFCGIITGQNHYQNSAGGVAHAVHLVGMFDLPENKTQK